MSCFGYQTVLFFMAFLRAKVSSDIYKSVMWTTNNPLFYNSSGLSPCFGEDLEMRVHLKSILPIVCPFEFIIMQTLPSRPAAGVLYENLWIVYDDKSFLTCNINTTYQNKQGEKNKKLFECNTPHILKSYTVDFIKEKSPVNPGISFVGGEYYYFLATSDGTDGSLNNTKGGHCNDAKVCMKFKVYICKDNDEKCRNVPIGDLRCPGDYKKAVSTTPFTTTKPSTQASATQPKPTPGDNVTTDAIDVTKSPTSGDDVITSAIVGMNHNKTKGTGGTMQFLESQELREALSRWKTVAITSICLAVVAVIVTVITIYCCMKRHKRKPACLRYLCDVAPGPDEGNGDDDKKTDGKNSFNNLSFAHDSIDGKKGNPMSSFKPNQAQKTMEMCPVPEGDEQDTKSKPLEQNDTSQKQVPDKSKSEVNSEKTTNGSVVRDSGGREKRQHNQNDGRERFPPLRMRGKPQFEV